MSTFLTLIILASAITVAQMYVGVNWRRANGSRRWVFVVGGVLNSMLVIPVGFMAVRYVRGIDSVAILIVAGIVLFLSLVALRHGLRGRRVGDHPHCRRCRFDLFGKPETSTQCPECGANLDEAHATVIGVRKRRPALIFLSLFLMLVSLGVGVPVGWDKYGSGIDWNKHKPDWWLVMQWDPSGRNWRVDREIKNRFYRHTFDDRTILEMIRKVSDAYSKDLRTADWIRLLVEARATKPLDDPAYFALVKSCSPYELAGPVDSVIHGAPIRLGRTTWSCGFGDIDTGAQFTDQIIGIKLNDQKITTDRILQISARIQAAPYIIEFIDVGALWENIELSHGPEDKPLTLEVTVKRKAQFESNPAIETEWEERVVRELRVTSNPQSVDIDSLGFESSNDLVTVIVDGNIGYLLVPILIPSGQYRAYIISNDTELDAGFFDTEFFLVQEFPASGVPNGKIRIELRPSNDFRWLDPDMKRSNSDHIIRLDNVNVIRNNTTPTAQ